MGSRRGRPVRQIDGSVAAWRRRCSADVGRERGQQSLQRAAVSARFWVQTTFANCLPGSGATDVGAIRDGTDTAMFWAAVDSSGRVIGGLRAKGPLVSPDDSHATTEWAGQPGLPAVRKMIADRIPFGVIEMKSAWTTDDRERAKRLSHSLARTMFHAMALLDAQFSMATSAPHSLEQWRTSGGVVAAIPATPYPDERYRTKMMWWDRRTFAKHAAAEQIPKILQEMNIVSMQASGIQQANRAVAR